MNDIKFANKTHEAAFYSFIERMSKADCYRISLAYLFALDSVCRSHINELYNFDENCIIPNGIMQSWQTSTSLRTTRLAFNLYNSFIGRIYDNDTESEVQIDPQMRYSVDEIFSCSYAPYYYEAIRLRYPEYCGGDDE